MLEAFAPNSLLPSLQQSIDMNCRLAFSNTICPFLRGSEGQALSQMLPAEGKTNQGWGQRLHSSIQSEGHSKCLHALWCRQQQ